VYVFHYRFAKELLKKKELLK